MYILILSKADELISNLRLLLIILQKRSCAGERLDHLIVTIAREHLNEEGLKEYPENGNVFCVRTSVKGIASFKCVL